MWPFSKKEMKERPVPDPPPVKIGERFRYLGVEMICSRHWAFPYDFPVIVAEYVTALGEIKQLTFCPVDWTALKAELSANAALTGARSASELKA